MNILNHRQDLNKLGISLHSRIVGILVDQIEEAICEGYIRVEYVDGKEWFSIYDFVRVILVLKSEWIVWKRFIEGDSDIPTFCTLISFTQESGRKSQKSPATNFTGLLYIAYLANCDFSKQLRKASAAHFASDRQIPIVEVAPPPVVFEQLAPITPKYLNLIGKTQAEICKLASDYLQIREAATQQMPTLIDILDHLANPANLEEIRHHFTARQWLTQNRRKMTPRQQRHFFRAIADCHRFLTITQPQKRDGVNYYNNRHELLLTACADNTIKLVRPTVPFI